MPKTESLKSVTTEKVRIAEVHVGNFSAAVREAMILADQFSDIEADEYVLPTPHMGVPSSPSDGYCLFEQNIYSRL